MKCLVTNFSISKTWIKFCINPKNIGKEFSIWIKQQLKNFGCCLFSFIMTVIEKKGEQKIKAFWNVTRCVLCCQNSVGGTFILTILSSRIYFQSKFKIICILLLLNSLFKRMIRTCVKNIGLMKNSCTGAAIRFNSIEPVRTRAKGKLRLDLAIKTTKLQSPFFYRNPRCKTHWYNLSKTLGYWYGS